MTSEITKNPHAAECSQILYSWNYLEWGGAQVLFFGLMKEAKKHAAVAAIIPSGSHPQLLKFLDNLQVPCDFFGSATDIKPANTVRRKLERHWNKLKSEIELIKYLKKRDLQNSIIHTELAPFQSMLTLLWLCRRMPVFVTMHNRLPAPGALRRLLWKIKFAILCRARNFHLFTANQDTKNSLAALVPKDFFEKIKIVYANINPEEIDEALRATINRSEILEKYKLPENKFLVFCVGQFIDRKGRWIFLEAARKLAAEFDDIQFVWISNYQPDAAELEKAESYQLGGKFRFLTSDQIGTEHVDLFKLLRMADVFALPSYLEGLPISIIEAMALGIPTISTNINAIPEAVIDRKTGILIEAGDSDALKDAIKMLKSNRELRRKLSIQGRAYALEKFDEQTVAKIAVAGYLEAIRGG